MILSRPNKTPCFFCGREKCVAAAVGAKGTLSICRSCASTALPALIAETSFIPLQDEELSPSMKDQNRSMPREYGLKWDLLRNTFLEKIVELCYGHDEFKVTEDGPKIVKE